MTVKLDSDSRLRFAPSPTGTLHIGGARTALFNWLLARNCGGKLVLRIEDTDRERSTPESVQAILDGLSWLGLDWDEGPLFQSKRTELYMQACDDLVACQKAYPCFCTEERLGELRKRAREEKKAFVYDGTCRDLTSEEAQRRIEAGEPHTLRFRIEPGSVTHFEDLIGGDRKFENDRLGDFIIRRSDGSPIYHLTVVVDDHSMGITHAVRGDDHLSNTPRQILIFEALGWTPPAYAHLPLIQGPDGARLSKRHGATGVMEYAREGFLPEAVLNFLALLGWSLDAETEQMDRQQLIDNFSLDRINRSAARFDQTKLEWLNGVYMRKVPLARIAKEMRRRFREAGLAEEKLEEPKFSQIVALEVERSRTFSHMQENLAFFFADRIEAYDPKAAKKFFLKEGSEEGLAALADALQNAEPFDAETLEARLRSLAEERGVGFGKLVHPLRLALTGGPNSPGIFDVLVCLGRETSMARVRGAIEWIEREKSAATTNSEGAS